MDDFKIVLKKRIKDIADSVRVRKGESRNYALSQLANEIRSILVKKEKDTADHATTVLDSFYFETKSKYYVSGELHNPVYLEDNIIMYPAIKNAQVQLISKKGSLSCVTDDKGCFGFSKSKKDLLPFEWDDLFFKFDGIEEFKGCLSDQIVLFLRLKFEGTKLSQNIGKDELEVYNKTFNNWFGQDDGFILFVDEAKITYEWLNQNNDSKNNRNIIEKLDDKKHNFYIYNEQQLIKLIPDKAFKGWTITEANIPQSIETIGDMSFRDCTNLEKINMTNNVDTLGGACFENCTNLKTIKLSKSIAHFPARCFKDCKNLEEIHLYENTKYLGAGCFEGCTSLKTIIIDAKQPPKQLGAFIGATPKNMTLVVPDESVGYYKTEYSSFNVKKLSEWEAKQ